MTTCPACGRPRHARPETLCGWYTTSAAGGGIRFSESCLGAAYPEECAAYREHNAGRDVLAREEGRG